MDDTSVAETAFPRIVFAGVATHDAIALVDRFPAANQRVPAQTVRQAGGGPAATAAVACARLGVPASFIGAIARDALGEAILDGLRGEGVDVSQCLRVDGEAGGSLVIVDRSEGTRAICNKPGPALAILPGSAAAASIAAADWVHVDQMGWGAVTALLATLPAHRRPRLSVDAGNAIPGFTLGGTALFAPTIERLQAGHDAATPLALLQSARRCGAGMVVATDGAEGSYAMDADGAWHIPAHRCEIVSTLGAGDVFHGALLAGLAHGLALPHAVAYANITAALSCRGLDGRSAIPTDAEVRALLPTLQPAALASSPSLQGHCA